MYAPADVITERINPAVGVVEAVDEHTCILLTGADRIDVLAVHVSLLGVDFDVTEPPELVEYVRTLAGRYLRATGDANVAATQLPATAPAGREHRRA